jgi:hypothetical protein
VNASRPTLPLGIYFDLRQLPAAHGVRPPRAMKEVQDAAGAPAWEPGHNFRGWSKYALSNDGSPYYTSLIVALECYSCDEIVDSSGNSQMSCWDWGVNN